jgi:predicted dehydrogenase
VAVADVEPEAARTLAAELGCESHDSHEMVGRRGGCDAVLVCTPPSTHQEICLHFLGQKVHVLCEKPLCLDAAGARNMVESARREGVILTMASKFRYVDAVIEARRIVASGALGEIILFENAFTSRVDMSKRWNSDPRVAGGGVLIDNGTHSVDIMRYFLGPVGEVMAVEGKRVQALPVEDTARMFIRSAGGVMGSIDLSWSVHKESESYIDVYGAAGTLRVGWKASRYRLAGSSDWVAFANGYDKFSALRRQVDNFCRAIRGEEPLLITGVDAIASVEVIQAAYESMSRNGWIPVQCTANGNGNGNGNGSSGGNGNGRAREASPLPLTQERAS